MYIFSTNREKKLLIKQRTNKISNLLNKTIAVWPAVLTDNEERYECREHRYHNDCNHGRQDPRCCSCRLQRLPDVDTCTCMDIAHRPKTCWQHRTGNINNNRRWNWYEKLEDRRPASQVMSGSLPSCSSSCPWHYRGGNAVSFQNTFITS